MQATYLLTWKKSLAAKPINAVALFIFTVSAAGMSYTTVAMADDLNTKALPGAAANLPSTAQTVNPPITTTLSPQPLPPKAVNTSPPGTATQMQKLPAALPQTNAPATLPANTGMQMVKPVGNLGAVKTIQFQKGVTKLDLKNEPDSTVLVGPNGQQKTVGQIKQDKANFLNTMSLKNPSYAQSGGTPLGKAPTRTAQETRMPLPLSMMKSELIVTAGMAKGCEAKAPNLFRVVKGTVTPFGAIIINGSCLGAARGKLRLFGPFSGGMAPLEVFHWDESSIIAQIPSDIKGVDDGPMMIEAVTADSKITPQIKVNFVAAMELVDVTRFFQALPICEERESKQACQSFKVACRANGLSAAVVTNTAYACNNFRRPNSVNELLSLYYGYKITINSKCGLQEVWSGEGPGRVKGLSGWPTTWRNSAVVNVSVEDSRSLEEHWYGDNETLAHGFNLAANASCPVGISPNP